jgi:uncharacterized protein (DUF2267 family)
MSQTVVELIQAKAGISAEQAQSAVDAVAEFLKEKLPEPVAGQIDNLLKADVSGMGDQVDNVMNTLGGLFGKKED